MLHKPIPILCELIHHKIELLKSQTSTPFEVCPYVCRLCNLPDFLLEVQISHFS